MRCRSRARSRRRMRRRRRAAAESCVVGHGLDSACYDAPRRFADYEVRTPRSPTQRSRTPLQYTMGNQPSAPVVPAFAPSDLLFFFVAMFGFLHFLTGMLALFLEVDMLYGTLLEVAKFKVPALEKGMQASFLRGPKKNGRGTVPNVRAWVRARLHSPVPYVFALMTGEQDSPTRSRSCASSAASLATSSRTFSMAATGRSASSSASRARRSSCCTRRPCEIQSVWSDDWPLGSLKPFVRREPPLRIAVSRIDSGEAT